MQQYSSLEPQCATERRGDDHMDDDDDDDADDDDNDDDNDDVDDVFVGTGLLAVGSFQELPGPFRRSLTQPC